MTTKINVFHSFALLTYYPITFINLNKIISSINTITVVYVTVFSPILYTVFAKGCITNKDTHWENL